jgi:sugar phosphate isomerase/epimerase
MSDAVYALANRGFKCIELSGGTEYYRELYDDLILLKEEYNLTYKIHNYFPPPLEHAVINLSSQDSQTVNASLGIINTAHQWISEGLAEEYSLHAGFLFEMTMADIGEAREKEHNSIPYEVGYDSYFKRLQKFYNEIGIKPIVENNVVSKANFLKFGFNPFLLTSAKEIVDALSLHNFDLLLDLAHLKVSAATLGHSFEKEAEILMPLTSYIHLSENDSKNDLNLPLKKDCQVLQILKRFKGKSSDFTLEVYSSLDDIEMSYDNLLRVI